MLLVEDDELIGAFLDMVENHKMIVENSGLLSVAALKQLDLKGKKVSLCVKRRQHGCHHHVFHRPARTDPERPYLFGICTSPGQTGRAGPGGEDDRG